MDINNFISLSDVRRIGAKTHYRDFLDLLGFFILNPQDVPKTQIEAIIKVFSGKNVGVGELEPC